MDDNDEKTPEELFEIIRDCCGELGWALSIDESTTAISGIIIGKRDFVDNIIDQLAEADNFSTYQLGQENLEMH